MSTALVRFDGVSLSFGDQRILDAAEFALEPGERVCLIGRNGAGKSTTLKLIAGRLEPDDGTIEIKGGIRFATLEQALADGTADPVRRFVAGGMAEHLARIERYEALAATGSREAATLREMEALEREVLAHGGWAAEQQIDATLSRLELPADKPTAELSGGWRRRVALARALVADPDVLMLDEPTNHLDIATIEWLEREIRGYSGAVLFVTHDRSFVERVATRIVDIDRGALRSWPGGYRDYLRRKARADADEDRHKREFDKKLAAEEAWIRQGVKAREHRNEGRVRALHAMRAERAERVPRPRTAQIHVNESEAASGRKVIEARNITHGFGDEPLVRDFSLRVMRGDRLGIIGNNGVGKSTLLKLLLGELEPDSGTVKLGTNLEIAYFDQLRRELDTSKTVAEIVGEGRDYITLNGRRKHVIAYLTDFLFSAKRARTRVAALSGGERNRVILARMFTQAANLLVLDEPTNDLDVETLEALEHRLAEYQGTLIVVSHDRHFLDAVITSTLVFESDGAIRTHAGGYSDWAAKNRSLAVAEEAVQAPPPTPAASPAKPRAKSPGKLSYKLKRELDALPEQIERLEHDVAELESEVSQPEFYSQPHTVTEPRLEQLAALERELESAIERWAELERLAEAARG